MIKKYKILSRTLLVHLFILLALSSVSWADVVVETNHSEPLFGLKVYAYTENNAYAGMSSTTDENGLAVFNPDDFSDGLYRFRVDYLGYQFWTEFVNQPSTESVPIEITEQTIPVNVSVSTGPITGVKVYLFSASETYLGKNSVTDSNGNTSFNLPVGITYKFRADYMGNQYWSDSVTIPDTDPDTVTVLCGGGLLQIHVKTGTEDLDGIKLYLFNTSNNYLSLNQTSDASGMAGFDLPQGTYRVRADYRGYQFWSNDITVNSTVNNEFIIPHQSVDITVNKVFQSLKEPCENINVYLYSATDQYLGEYQTTDASGQISVSLPEMAYKVRADYMNEQYWSQEFTWENSNINIPMSKADITVTENGQALEGVKVYAFTASGSYLGLNQTTNTNGNVNFSLPEGTYTFRSDHLNNQYWSNEISLSADQEIPIDISTGGGSLTLTVLKGANDPIQNVKCYLFSGTGSYLGENATTDTQGKVTFNLSDGNYKIRVDYRGYQFLTGTYEVTESLSEDFLIAHQDVTISVNKVFQEEITPAESIKTYLFSSTDQYLGEYQITDSNGQVVISLPEMPYKVRSDFMNQQYFSSIFTWEDTSIGLPMAEADITATGSGQPIEGVNVYVFTSTRLYLGINGATDVEGRINFRLPSGSYLFRYDYLGSQYWSDEILLEDNQTMPVEISTGGGTLSLKVTKGADDPLVGINCYLFNLSGTYLGKSAATGNEGIVSFGLAEGDYKIRIDYLGYQFWSDDYHIDGNLTDEKVIQHTDVTITIEKSYETPESLEGVKVYLFKPNNQYMGRYLVTDSNGQVVFNLPDQQYKVRVDYMGQQRWSEEFQGIDQTVIINHGRAEIKTIQFGAGVENARVYLFNESGGYLSQYNNTDATGKIEFILPQGAYTFRADYGGSQYWSNIVNINWGETTPVLIELSTSVAVEMSITPEIIQSGGASTLSWVSSNASTLVIEPEIGMVDLNGSLIINPLQTTTYQVTATGSSGSAMASVTVEVQSEDSTVPDDIYYGLFDNEQQGGGGLLANTIRVLNGNALEYRNDVTFPSPNRFGLSIMAVYNSRSDRTGALGFGWSHSYESFLESIVMADGTPLIRIMDQTGRFIYFQEGNEGIYHGYFNEKSTLQTENGNYVWRRLDGGKFLFDTTGKLISMLDEAGNTLSLSYSNTGVLETVTDSASNRILTFGYNGNGSLETIGGPVTTNVSNGIWVTYGYDSNQNLVSVTYADGSGFSYGYADSSDIHKLTEKKDKMDHLLGSFGYDVQDRVTSKFSSENGSMTIEYQDDNIKITDPYGVIRTYTLTDIEGVKRLASRTGISNPPYNDGNIIAWQYDDFQNLVETEHSNGSITQYKNHDDRGNPRIITYAEGTIWERTISCTYHPLLNFLLSKTELSVLESGNKSTEFDYDNDSNATPNENPTMHLYRIIEKGFTKNTGLETVPYEYIKTFSYNAKGQVLSIDGEQSGNGDTYSFTYDIVTGDLESVTRPSTAGTVSYQSHDASGRPLTVIDPNGFQISYTYDGRGRTLTVTHASDGASTIYQYNTAGLISSVTDPDGLIKSFDYDTTYGRIEQRTDSEGNYILFDYNAQGDLTEKYYYDASDTLLKWKKWDYQNHPDFPGMLFKEITPPNDLGDNDSYTEFRYDSAGNISAITDPKGNTTTYAHNELNMLMSMTQPGNIVTSNQYDIHGNHILVTDAENRDTIYTYDDMGRVLSRISPDSGTTRYVYDEAGNLSSKTDARDITVAYSHDPLNRLTMIDFPNDTDTTYTYDQPEFYDTVNLANLPTHGIGKLTGMNDASGVTSFYYNEREKLTSKTIKYIHPTNQDEFTYKTTASYSPGGRIESLIYPHMLHYLPRRSVEYLRSSCMCKVDTVTTTYDGNVTTLVENISYQAFGQSTGLNMGNGNASSNLYDESGRLRHSNANTQGEHFYKYDKNGNIIGIYTNRIVARNQNAPDNEFFDYDPMGRLLSARGPYGTISYTYDHVGNRLTRTINDETETYSYLTGTNKIENITGAEIIDFTYDAAGNTITKGDMTLTWNDNNRLSHAEKPDEMIVDYVYNGLGQRVWKKISMLSTSPQIYSSTIEHYDFDGKIITESNNRDRYYKKILREYVYKGSSPVALITNKVLHYHNDHLQTPRSMTNAADETVFKMQMLPFGSVERYIKSDEFSNLRFPGQVFDYPTDFYYNYFRYYDPDTGRYISTDPIGLEGGINLYAYVLNDPVNLVDPLGLYWFRQDWQEPGVVGRPGTPVPPEGLISEFIEQNVPAGYTFGQLHDAYVDLATKKGEPDWKVNIPSMPAMYYLAQLIEIMRSLGILEQPQSPEPSPCE